MVSFTKESLLTFSLAIGILSKMIHHFTRNECYKDGKNGNGILLVSLAFKYYSNDLRFDSYLTMNGSSPIEV